MLAIWPQCYTLYWVLIGLYGSRSTVTFLLIIYFSLVCCSGSAHCFKQKLATFEPFIPKICFPGSCALFHYNDYIRVELQVQFLEIYLTLGGGGVCITVSTCLKEISLE